DANIITAASAINLDAGATKVLSVSFWAKSTFGSGGADSTAPNIDINNSGPKFIGSTSAGKLRVNFPGASGVLTGDVALATDPAATGSNVNAGTGWHLIVVTARNNTAGNNTFPTVPDPANDNIVVYFDGNNPQVVTGVTTTRSGANTWGTFAVKLGSGAYVGGFDDARFYNRALTSGEITALYAAG